jgi:hypothetical protein
VPDVMLARSRVGNNNSYPLSAISEVENPVNFIIRLLIKMTLLDLESTRVHGSSSMLIKVKISDRPTSFFRIRADVNCEEKDFMSLA